MLKHKVPLYWVLGIIVISFISWDLLNVTQVQVTYPTYKKLSDIDSTKKNTTTVSIIGSDYNELASPVSLSAELTYNQIEAMVFKALDKQESSNQLFTSGVKVLIKPNIVGAKATGDGENTDIRVIKALVKYIHNKTSGNCTIKIGEGSPRPMPYEIKFSGGTSGWNGELWDYAGYPDLLDELKGLGINVDTVNLNGGNTANPLQNLTEVAVPNGGYAYHQGGKYYIHNEIINADVYITVPVLKVHNPGITNGLKNQIGITPGNRYGFNKMQGVIADGRVNKLIHNKDAPRDWTDEEIVDLSLLAGIDLVVVDATLVLEKQKTAGYPVRMNTVVVGNDPVAVDNVCARMAGFNPDDVDHIALAELSGMGTNDTSLINIVGSTLIHVKKRLRKLTSDARLMYGQSNRKWLVSQAYSTSGISNPIAHQFIANEANYEAKPGLDGWSQPMYFFDDKIDLGNYFSYTNNIVAYTFAYVYSPIAKDALLQIGSENSMCVYFNKSLVYSYTGTRTYTYVAETCSIHLNQGYNALLVKTLQPSSGNHDFALNICDIESDAELSGHRVAGLKFYPTKIETNINFVKSNNSITKCFPNPASTYTKIDIKVENPGNYRINVYNLQGKVVKPILNNYLRPGNYSYTWNLDNSKGEMVSRGIYVVKEEFSKQTAKIIVNR
jgi:uncharacterized protein (DUF362 family)